MTQSTSSSEQNNIIVFNKENPNNDFYEKTYDEEPSLIIDETQESCIPLLVEFKNKLCKRVLCDLLKHPDYIDCDSETQYQPIRFPKVLDDLEKSCSQLKKEAKTLTKEEKNHLEELEKKHEQRCGELNDLRKRKKELEEKITFENERKQRLDLQIEQLKRSNTIKSAELKRLKQNLKMYEHSIIDEKDNLMMNESHSSRLKHHFIENPQLIKRNENEINLNEEDEIVRELQKIFGMKDVSCLRGINQQVLKDKIVKIPNDFIFPPTAMIGFLSDILQSKN